MESTIDYCLVEKICLSIVKKKNFVYGMQNIEDRIKTFFYGSIMRHNITNFLIRTCEEMYKIKLEKISVNDLPSNIPVNPQNPTGYFQTNDMYVLITTEVPYLLLYKRYTKS